MYQIDWRYWRSLHGRLYQYEGYPTVEVLEGLEVPEEQKVHPVSLEVHSEGLEVHRE